MKLKKKIKYRMGTDKDPLVLRVNDESRIEEVTTICDENNWIFILGIEYDQPEDISDLEFMLEPESFGGKRPKAGKSNSGRSTHVPVTHKGRYIGRNDPCPCGSGKKHKKCCM